MSFWWVHVCACRDVVDQVGLLWDGIVSAWWGRRGAMPPLGYPGAGSIVRSVAKMAMNASAHGQ